jgi:hypothetical protein
MAYFSFLKSLRSLGECRKNPHVKIPPKSPWANFQSLCIFKKSKFYSEIILLSFRPSRGPFFFFFQPADFPSPPHWASASRPAQPTITAQPASRCLHSCPNASTGREKWPHLITLHFPPLIGAISPLFNPRNRRLQPRH